MGLPHRKQFLSNFEKAQQRRERSLQGVLRALSGVGCAVRDIKRHDNHIVVSAYGLSFCCFQNLVVVGQTKFHHKEFGASYARMAVYEAFAPYELWRVMWDIGLI